METQILNFTRDDAGNFTYRQDDGNIVTVFGNSPTADSFEIMWSCAQELLEAERSRRTHAALAKKSQKSFLGWLRGLFPQKRSRSPAAFGARPSTLIAPLKAAPRAPAANPAAPPLVQPVPIPARVARSDQPSFSISSLSKHPVTGEYRIKFAEGIDVTVPAGSNHAKKFDQCFADIAKIKRSVDQVAPAAPARGSDDFSVTSPDAKHLTGHIVLLGPGSNTKPRFAIKADNSDAYYPLPLSDRGNTILFELLQKQSVVRVHASAEQTSLVELEILEIRGADGTTQKTRFRDLLRPARRKKATPSPVVPLPTTPEVPSAAPAPPLTNEFAERDDKIRSALKNPILHPELFKKSEADRYHIEEVDIKQSAPDRITISMDIVHEEAPEQDGSKEEVIEAEFIAGADGQWQLSEVDADKPAAHSIAFVLNKSLPDKFKPVVPLNPDGPPHVGNIDASGDQTEASIPFEELPPMAPPTPVAPLQPENLGRVTRIEIPIAEEVDGPTPG
jgi:hypothetical protein